MRVILWGYNGSQKIVPASRYLTNKYLPFSVSYVNYMGDINCWSSFLQGYLTNVPDDYIIFALDDYLVANKLDEVKFWMAYNEIAYNHDVVCIKLCHSTPEEHEEYPVTTQYCIWNRKYLIELLGKVKTPWQFEIEGSKLFNKICLHRPCLEYFTNSSISSRWEGIRLDGLKEEDINELKNLGYV